ncbi:MAG: methylthioribulose 1-phosphate dehydratase [Bacteroidota bacterium]|jgi:methylthioribulose-1-phosphate dehydratase
MKEKLAETIRLYHLKGWSPATSTNYSFMEDGQIWVSRSGVDKSNFQAADFIPIDENGLVQAPFQDIKPSDETMIHVLIYRLFPQAKVILHSHSKNPVLISMKHKETFSVGNYELQKGFSGVTTHECTVHIPIFENAQDMGYFEKYLPERISEIQQHCFLIRQHGTYAWGENLFAAKRHLETLDYLCECELAQ